jgi:hypothetical protein
MNKFFNFLRLEVMTKHSTVASAAQITGPETSPHPLLVPASSNLVTEAVKVCRQEKKKRLFVEVKATLAPRLGYNLVTCAKVKWLGLEDTRSEAVRLVPNNRKRSRSQTNRMH